MTTDYIGASRKVQRNGAFPLLFRAAMTESELQTPARRGARRGNRRRRRPPRASSTRMRAAPFEDLGFARVDTHRHLRQGFPEVDSRPRQNARTDRGDRRAHRARRAQSLLVTRATHEAYDAVRDGRPGRDVSRRGARHHAARRARSPAGTAPCLIACAGTSDLPVAEEAAVTAELMGNTVDRLYDVGVAGLHRLLQRARPAAARPRADRRGRHGRRAAERGRRAGARAGDCGADQRRLRRQLRRHRGAARHAQQLRQRRVRS